VGAFSIFHYSQTNNGPHGLRHQLLCHLHSLDHGHGSGFSSIWAPIHILVLAQFQYILGQTIEPRPIMQINILVRGPPLYTTHGFIFFSPLLFLSWFNLRNFTSSISGPLDLITWWCHGYLEFGVILNF
jgi:hypothetical protein